MKDCDSLTLQPRASMTPSYVLTRPAIPAAANSDYTTIAHVLIHSIPQYATCNARQPPTGHHGHYPRLFTVNQIELELPEYHRSPMGTHRLFVRQQRQIRVTPSSLLDQELPTRRKEAQLTLD